MVSSRIALLGCNALFREGLRLILEDTAFKVVLSSDQPDCLPGLASRQAGDLADDLIVIIDQSSLEYAQSEIRQIMDKVPGAKLVCLAGEFDLDNMIAAFNAGAHGYIIKDIRCESLIASLQLIALGEKVLPGELAEQLSKGSPANASAALVRNNLHELLSDREIEILRCLAAGFPNKVIANRLALGDSAVKVHVKGILRKLNVSNRTQAAVLAYNSGLVPALQDQDAQADAAVVPGNPEDGAAWNGDGWTGLAKVA